MGWLSKLLGRENPARRDAARIYSKLMDQSRNAAFYGDGRAPDSYDGRIDMLTLHLAPVMAAARTHGEQGELLSQELYEVMREDFDVALREEGLTDSSITHRIKPMIGLFYARLKSYTEALTGENKIGEVEAVLTAGLLKDAEPRHFVAPMAQYLRDFHAGLEGKPLGDLAMTQFDFPELPS
ncbi:MAG: ubiquinol-cytochrome C chaperone family protein [Maricaulaceae bacterium]